jgi:small subunit ribosomal protein S2
MIITRRTGGEQVKSTRSWIRCFATREIAEISAFRYTPQHECKTIGEGDVDVLTMKELLETGVHFGHRTRKWNPKMARYIFTERKGIHIIDLEQTVDLFRKAYYFVRDTVANGGEVVFVGTKKQVQATIIEEAQRCGAHYINRRWLGGTLTNFGTVKLSIERMKKMEAIIEDGTIEHMPNKEASRLRRRLAKLQQNLDGLRNMEKRPSLMFVIDPDSETIAVHEANLAGVPVIAIVDTNCDPDPIDFLIPGNDDAIKATKLITARIADAVLEGREGRQDAPDSPTAAADATAEVEKPVADPSEDAAEVESEVESEVEPEADIEEEEDDDD